MPAIDATSNNNQVSPNMSRDYAVGNNTSANALAKGASGDLKTSGSQALVTVDKYVPKIYSDASTDFSTATGTAQGNLSTLQSDFQTAQASGDSPTGEYFSTVEGDKYTDGTATVQNEKTNRSDVKSGVGKDMSSKASTAQKNIGNAVQGSSIYTELSTELSQDLSSFSPTGTAS